jgi:hypothetical protein
MAKKHFILSIDGGGIRGLIPAMVLAELEKRLATAGKPTQLAKHFDMIAGMSILMQGQVSTVSYQMRSIFGTPKGRYFRSDGKLMNASDDLDDASPQNIKNLKVEATNIIAANTASLDKIVAAL